MNTSVTQNGSDVKLSVAQIESLPNYKHKGNGEYSAVCPNPHCDSDEDAFLFWPDVGNFWCRKCGLEGFVTDKAFFTITPEIQAKIKRQRQEREQAKHQKHLTAIEQLQRERKDVIYHQNLNGNSGYVKKRWGVTDDTIDIFKVGYCSACPTSPYSDSITIPYYYHEKLINLRHRLSSPNGDGKYRPEMSGLPQAIFNADLLDNEDWLVLVEGEFKAMVLCQYGLPAIAIPGASNHKLIERWAKKFGKVDRVYITLDWYAEQHARQIGLTLSKTGVDVRIVTLPVDKPDDFFVIHGGNVGQFCRYLELGRRL